MLLDLNTKNPNVKEKEKMRAKLSDSPNLSKNSIVAGQTQPPKTLIEYKKINQNQQCT